MAKKYKEVLNVADELRIIVTFTAMMVRGQSCHVYIL